MIDRENLFKCGFTLLMILCHLPSNSQQIIERLSNSSINTRGYDEIAPVVSKNEKTIYFTRQGFPLFNKTLMEGGMDMHKKLSEAAYNQKLKNVYSSLAGEKIRDAVGSDFNQDIWMATSKRDYFDHVEHLEDPLNNAFPNSLCALFNDDRSAILINQFPKDGDILPGFSISHRNKSGYWSYPEPIYIEGIEDIKPDVSLAVGNDGETIILSIDKENAYGGNDLYVSFRTGENSYGKPIHLGAAANSPSHEKSPFLSSDGKTLFFSSNRRSSMGGYDIYMVYRLDDTWENWTAPNQFSAPINSSANEGFPCFNRETGNLYIASDREGSSDLFKAKVAPPISNEVTVAGNILDPNKKIKQKDATVLLRAEKTGIYTSSLVSTDGYYEMTVPLGEKYQLLARKTGFQGKRTKLNFKRSDVYFKKVHIDLILNALKEGQAIDLNTIYFEKSKAIVLDKSTEELDYLVDIMTSNPNLKIAIEGHTDNLGGSEQLQTLSKSRAETIKDYLTIKGLIASSRIETIGFGDTRPLNDNSTEVLRKQNRRVEVKVISIDDLNETATSSID